ncbi:MAG TPA: sugar kinase, partial [Micromonospora sp.]
EGVATRVRRIAAADTGLMIKERGVGGHTRVWYYRTGSAGSHLQRSDVPEELIRSARVLHVTGITPALSATASDAVTYACQVAREHGVAVSFDVNFRSRLWNRELAATTLTEVVKLADIVFAGLTEVSLFTGADREPIEAARSLARLGPRQVVVKRGTAGACAWADGAAYVQEAIPVSVVDPVGSGDAFAAGYLRELVGGAPVVERLATAARSGAFACTVPGDWEGMPRYEELDLLSSPANVTR